MARIKLETILENTIREEDARFTVEKATEIYNKHKNDLKKNQDFLERMSNIFKAFTIGDLLEDDGVSTIEKIEKSAETFNDKMDDVYSKLSDLSSDMYDEYSDNHNNDAKELSRKLRDLDNIYHELGRKANIIYNFAYDIKSSREDWKEEQIKKIR